MPVEQKLIQQAFKFALAPTPRQERAFFSHAGAARYSYNWGISAISDALDAYRAEKATGVEKPTTKIPGHFDLCKAWTAFKNDPESGVPWVGENFSGMYQAALRDAHVAWRRFFESRAGRHRGRSVGRPRFKSRRRSRRSFQVHGSGLRVHDTRHVNLPVIGLVRTHESTRKIRRRLNAAPATCPTCRGEKKTPDSDGALKACKACKATGSVPAARLVRGTISQDSRGRWYISLTVEMVREVRTGPSRRQRDGGTVGIDLGVRDLATLSDGVVISNPRHLDGALRKLRHAQQTLSRRKDDSRRREAARRRVARLHGRVAAMRRDGLSKAASSIIHSHALIGVEGFDIQQTLAANSPELPRRIARDRNRALASAGLGEFRWMLESRASWYGATVVVADRHQETGRTCAACGTVRTKPIPPAEARFRCLSCGHTADRRVNTAQMVAKMARTYVDAPSGGESQNGRGGDVRPAAPRRSGRSPTKRQASTRPNRRGETGTPGP